MALSVFPERMNKLDTADVNSSLRTLESYVNYMVERTEFAITNTFRTTTGLGSSAEAVALVLQETADKVASLSSDVNAMQGSLRDILDSLGTLTEALSAAQASITDLDARVTALEHPEPEPEP